jgi:hypothetical protein
LLSRLAVAAGVGLLLLVLLPGDAHAWTPGTHIFLGETVLANLRLLPAVVADLLHAYPWDYLYGSIAADTSIAKKYVPPGRHSHFWHVGQETYDRAPTDRLKAFGLGYLSHLAADTVAHNYFVPRQLLLTSSARSMGHSYWESRVEAYLTSAYARKAKQIITLDQAPADRHLEDIISPTLFSVRTNRRIFRSLVHLADTKGWQETMRVARERSRWMLTDAEVERHLAVSYDYIIEMLRSHEGRAKVLDPTGHKPLAQSKRLRRKELVGGAWGDRERMLGAATAHFGLPADPLEFWVDSVVTRPWLLPPAGVVVPVPPLAELVSRVEPPAA